MKELVLKTIGVRLLLELIMAGGIDLLNLSFGLLLYLKMLFLGLLWHLIKSPIKIPQTSNILYALPFPLIPVLSL